MMTDSEKNLLTVLESSSQTLERVYTLLCHDVIQDSEDEYVNALDKHVVKSLFEGVQKIKKEVK